MCKIYSAKYKFNNKKITKLNLKKLIFLKYVTLILISFKHLH